MTCTGLVQIAIDGNTAEQALFARAETIRSEYVLAVRGEIAARTPENVNPNMKTGKIELSFFPSLSMILPYRLFSLALQSF